MGAYNAADLRTYQIIQADKLVEHLGPEFTPEVIAETNKQRDQMLALSPQLFVQAMLTIYLLSEVLQTATVYHAFRFPPELGHFDWVVDAKDQKITTMESLWSTLMMPILETQGFTKPFVSVREGNYSAFKRFEVRASEAPAAERRHLEWVKNKTPRAQGTDYTGIYFGEIFKSLRFRNSRDEPGLQLADIVASALCRAFNGNLCIDGWGEIGELFVAQSTELGGSIKMVKLDASGTGEELRGHHQLVRRYIEARAVDMFPNSSPPGQPTNRAARPNS
jgi:hypothetical protein